MCVITSKIQTQQYQMSSSLPKHQQDMQDRKRQDDQAYAST
jgi:hypothetical protein